jgi:DNA-binding transcriptional ArsR family regulator
MRGNVVPLERGLEDNTGPLWRALADPTRRRILDLLRERPLITGEIAARFPISRIAVMRHLEVLSEAGLVTSRKRGRERWHYLNAVPLQQLHRRWADPAAAGFASALLRLADTIEAEGGPMESNRPTIDVALDIEIAGTPTSVFAALTKDVGGWWGHPFVTARATSLALDPRLGGLFTEQWDSGGQVIASVTGWARDEHLQLTGPFHLGVAVGVATFDLAASGTGTLLRFSFRAIGVVDAAVGEAMSRGWAELVQTRLKGLVETGTRLGIDPDEPSSSRRTRLTKGTAECLPKSRTQNTE